MNLIQKQQEKICAVVVTYNRKDLLLECLEALRKQTRPLQGIYIIDNASGDGTPEFLYEQGYIKVLPPQNLKSPWEKEFKIENLVNKAPIKIHYVRMHKNTGGAGGFHEGVKRAYEKGYDWLWLMDDDVEPEKNALEILLSYKDISKFIHPRRKDVNGNIYPWEGYIDLMTGLRLFLNDISFSEESNKNFTCVNIACFEGALISKQIVDKIGYPDKRFFIVHDDTSYGLKASKYFNVILIRDAIITKKIIKRNKYSKTYSYYVIRNTFLLRKYLNRIYPIKKYFLIRKVFLILELLRLSYLIIKTNKLKGLSIIYRALKDGIQLSKTY